MTASGARQCKIQQLIRQMKKMSITQYYMYMALMWSHRWKQLDCKATEKKAVELNIKTHKHNGQETCTTQISHQQSINSNNECKQNNAEIATYVSHDQLQLIHRGLPTITWHWEGVLLNKNV